VKTTLMVTAGEDEQLAWSTADSCAVQYGSALDFAAAATLRDTELVLVVPAQKVLLQDVAFAASERRMLRQTLPYSLEEQLVDDVDLQHFALGAINGTQVPVAIVEKQWLMAWLQRCEQAGLDIVRALPEQLLLPWREQCWSLWPTPTRWLVRFGRYRGFALEPTSAALALQLMLDGAAQLPEKLIVYSATTELEPELIAQLPDLLRGIVEMAELPQWPAGAGIEPTIDLLQGDFARALPWRRWWLQWQRPAIVLALVVALQFIVMGVQHHRLNKQNIALRQQIEAVYRSVEPRGVVNDPELQLRRKVDALQGHQGSAALPLLQQVGSALKSITSISVQNLTYSEKQGELRLSISGDAFKDIEAVRLAIEKIGLTAQLVGSNADGEKTRAQLRITERH
jgi:general secretion pathway protein L